MPAAGGNARDINIIMQHMFTEDESAGVLVMLEAGAWRMCLAALTRLSESNMRIMIPHLCLLRQIRLGQYLLQGNSYQGHYLAAVLFLIGPKNIWGNSS